MYPSPSDLSIFNTAAIAAKGVQHLATQKPASVWFAVPERDYSDCPTIDQVAAMGLVSAMLKDEPFVPNQVLRAALLSVARIAGAELGYNVRKRPDSDETIYTLTTLRPV